MSRALSLVGMILAASRPEPGGGTWAGQTPMDKVSKRGMPIQTGFPVIIVITSDPPAADINGAGAF
jgi:hypothetical protein